MLAMIACKYFPHDNILYNESNVLSNKLPLLYSLCGTLKWIIIDEKREGEANCDRESFVKLHESTFLGRDQSLPVKQLLKAETKASLSCRFCRWKQFLQHTGLWSRCDCIFMVLKARIIQMFHIKVSEFSPTEFEKNTGSLSFGLLLS